MVDQTHGAPSRISIDIACTSPRRQSSKERDDDRPTPTYRNYMDKDLRNKPPTFPKVKDEPVSPSAPSKITPRQVSKECESSLPHGNNNDNNNDNNNNAQVPRHQQQENDWDEWYGRVKEEREGTPRRGNDNNNNQLERSTGRNSLEETSGVGRGREEEEEAEKETSGMKRRGEDKREEDAETETIKRGRKRRGKQQKAGKSPRSSHDPSVSREATDRGSSVGSLIASSIDEYCPVRKIVRDDNNNICSSKNITTNITTNQGQKKAASSCAGPSIITRGYYTYVDDPPKETGEGRESSRERDEVEEEFPAHRQHRRRRRRSQRDDNNRRGSSRGRSRSGCAGDTRRQVFLRRGREGAVYRHVQEVKSSSFSRSRDSEGRDAPRKGKGGQPGGSRPRMTKGAAHDDRYRDYRSRSRDGRDGSGSRGGDERYRDYYRSGCWEERDRPGASRPQMRGESAKGRRHREGGESQGRRNLLEHAQYTDDEDMSPPHRGRRERSGSSGENHHRDLGDGEKTSAVWVRGDDKSLSPGSDVYEELRYDSLGRAMPRAKTSRAKLKSRSLSRSRRSRSRGRFRDRDGDRDGDRDRSLSIQRRGRRSRQSRNMSPDDEMHRDSKDVFLLIENKQCGKIIGYNGKGLKLLSQNIKAEILKDETYKVEVRCQPFEDRDRDTDERFLRIRGVPEYWHQEATYMILEIIGKCRDMNGNVLKLSSLEEEDVDEPFTEFYIGNKDCGVLISRGLRSIVNEIRDIMRNKLGKEPSGVRIIIDPFSERRKNGSRRMRLMNVPVSTMKQEMVDFFLPLVKYLEDDGEILKDTHELSKRGEEEIVEIKIEQEKVGLLLGRGGINIKRIEVETKTLMGVDQGHREEGYSILKIEGIPDRIAEARERVDELLAVEVILPAGQRQTMLKKKEDQEAREEAEKAGLPYPPAKEDADDGIKEERLEVTPYGIGWPSQAEQNRYETIPTLAGKVAPVIPVSMPIVRPMTMPALPLSTIIAAQQSQAAAQAAQAHQMSMMQHHLGYGRPMPPMNWMGAMGKGGYQYGRNGGGKGVYNRMAQNLQIVPRPSHQDKEMMQEGKEGSSSGDVLNARPKISLELAVQMDDPLVLSARRMDEVRQAVDYDDL